MICTVHGAHCALLKVIFEGTLEVFITNKQELSFNSLQHCEVSAEIFKLYFAWLNF